MTSVEELRWTTICTRIFTDTEGKRFNTTVVAVRTIAGMLHAFFCYVPFVLCTTLSCVARLSVSEVIIVAAEGEKFHFFSFQTR